MTKTDTKMPTVQPDINQWIESEIKRVDALKMKQLQDRGYTPFYQFPEGETRITLVKKLPEPHERYEGRMNFHITVNKESYLWSVTKIGPIYRQLLDAMRRGQTAITVIRVGQGRNTRWSLKH
jgi:hypothetical protein